MPELPAPKIRPQIAVAHPPLEPPPIAYAELQVTSNFSFLRGGSHPEELVTRAAETGCRAVAITDINTLAGIVRGHTAAKDAGIPFIVGCHVQVKATTDGGHASEGEGAPSEACELRGNAVQDDGTLNMLLPRTARQKHGTPDSADGLEPSELSLLLYPTTRGAYGRLCRLLTLGKRRAPKGQCALMLQDVLDMQAEALAIVLPPPVISSPSTVAPAEVPLSTISGVPE